MSMQIRWVSVVQRKLRAAKERRQTLESFTEGREMQRRLRAPAPSGKKLLVIRLDDIGDYLLFRNQLGMYKKSSLWKAHAVTLLGNASWKDVFTACDSACVDDTLWIDKAAYLTSADYKLEVWEQLRARGFETVIAPSRTRPLVLDDLCMLAAAPLHNIGCVNTYVHPQWNQVSDALYQRLFKPADTSLHEFHFNAEFAAEICGVRSEAKRPTIDVHFPRPLEQPYIVCFVGANTRSKRWPVKRWVEFIERYSREFSGRVIVAGGNKTEIAMASAIEQRTGAQSIAGKVSLPELFAWVEGAQAVLTNDTMAAHLGASYSRPTVIVANGVNYRRFTEYAHAGIEQVATVYPDVFNRKRRRRGELSYNYVDAISSDMASIEAATVLTALKEIL
jgi:ADP-heptose:LPS heptosyltransferase